MTRLRLALVLCLLAAASLVAACGGSDSDKGAPAASASTDVDELLTQTFTGAKRIDSGRLDASIRIDAQGEGSDELQGPVTVTLAGPFEAQGDALPKFKLDLAFDGAGQSIKAGVTSTGDKGFVAFQGTDYVVSDQIFRQLRAGYEEAQKQGEQQNADSFASLGIDPRKWLTDPTNAGEVKVGEADTIKITGGVAVPALLDDVNRALDKASSLGLQGAGQVPEKLTEAQKRKVAAAVKDPSVELYTGKEDKILRRMVVKLGVDDPDSTSGGRIALDISLTGLNVEQTIEAPSSPKPFDELLSQFGGLGALGGGSSASGGAGSEAGGDADFDKYSKCIEKAGSDVDKARACADLLTG